VLGTSTLYRPNASVWVDVISRPVQSRMEIGMNGGAYFSPNCGEFESNSFAVSSRTKPTMCPAIGACVKRKKLAPGFWPSRSVTSFWSHSGRWSPPYAPRTPGKSASSVGTSCSEPTQKGTARGSYAAPARGGAADAPASPSG
jgi:hypothetical protein